MDDDSQNIDGNKDKIGRINGVDNARLEAVGHAETGHEIFRLVPLNREEVRDNSREGHKVKTSTHFLGYLCILADEILGRNHVHNGAKDGKRTPEVCFFRIRLDKKHTKTKAPDGTRQSKYVQGLICGIQFFLNPDRTEEEVKSNNTVYN